MFPRIFVLVALLFSAQLAKAEEINIQLSNDTARFMYLTEAFGQDFGRLELEAGFLYGKNNSSLLNVGLMVRGESVSLPVLVAVGGRMYFAKVDTYTVGALAIGGDLLLAPESWNGFGLGAYFYTAPGVVTFADAESLTEYGLYMNFQITPQAKIAVGYQQINTAIRNANTVVIDQGTYFALNLSF